METSKTEERSDEWYTPLRITTALDCTFDQDVASPVDRTHTSIKAKKYFTIKDKDPKWEGFIWMNPPFGDSKTKTNWYRKFIEHNNGIALSTDRTCTKWFHYMLNNSDSMFLFIGRPSFVKPSGELGKGAATNTCLWSSGNKGTKQLKKLEKLGLGKFINL